MHQHIIRFSHPAENYISGLPVGNGRLAAMVCGARVPCVLTSRGDTAKTKSYSIALAALMAK